MLQYIVYKMIIYFNVFVIIYVVIVSIANMLQMMISMIYTPAYLRKARFADMKRFSESANIIPLSILVPAYNEEPVIVDSIKTLLNLNYSTYEVIVINDGSDDGTLNAILDAFGLKRIACPVRTALTTGEVYAVYYNPEYPMLRLIDKKNGGKADALNAGINLSRYPYFASVDADSLLDEDALIRIAMPFMEYKYTVAVGGIVRVANGSRIENGKLASLALPGNIMARFQINEYFRAFLVGRVGWSLINSLLIISGAFGAFQKSFVIEVGGYTTGTIGEDMELVLKLHRHMRSKKYKYRISFLPDPICWTQVPESIKNLYGQRRRWHIGLMDSLWRSRDMFLNPRYGTMGVLAMPYYFFFELLGPVVEGLGFVIIPLSCFFGFLSVDFFVLFLLVTTIFGIILSVGALMIEEFTFNKYVRLRDFFILSLYSVIENFCYRQMTVVFRLSGVIRYRKYKHSWSKMKRQDFAGQEPKTPTTA